MFFELGNVSYFGDLRHSHGHRSAGTVANVTSPTTRRHAIAALLVTVIALAIGIQLGVRHVDPPHAHPAQASITASPLAPSTMVEQHPHLRDVVTALAPDMEATAGLPRANSTLLELGVAVLLRTALMCWRAHRLAAGRGPPEPDVLVENGRRLLTRLCISRR